MVDEDTGMVTGTMSQHEDSARCGETFVGFPFRIGEAYQSGFYLCRIIRAPSQVVASIGQDEVGFRVKLHDRPQPAFPTFADKGEPFVFYDVRILAGVDFHFYIVGGGLSDGALGG